MLGENLSSRKDFQALPDPNVPEALSSSHVTSSACMRVPSTPPQVLGALPSARHIYPPALLLRLLLTRPSGLGRKHLLIKQASLNSQTPKSSSRFPPSEQPMWALRALVTICSYMLTFLVPFRSCISALLLFSRHHVGGNLPDFSPTYAQHQALSEHQVTGWICGFYFLPYFGRQLSLKKAVVSFWGPVAFLRDQT